MAKSKKSRNRPRGPNVCPRVNETCAKALLKFITYFNGDSSMVPSEEEYSIVDSFAVNLEKEITWNKQRREKAEKNRKEAEIERLKRAQAKDMKETGHGAL